MAQLQHLEDIADLDIKSLDEVIENSQIPYKIRRKLRGLEQDLIASGRAPSLPAFLLYEHQFNGKSFKELADELNYSHASIYKLTKKLNIPIRSNLEASQSSSGKHIKKDKQRK